MPEITQEIACELLDYDPATGKLTWKERGQKWFKSGRGYPGRACKSWNSHFAGKVALSTIKSNGYMHGSLFYKCVMAHRIIWLMVHGKWPDTIDHVNGNRSDNRLNNLREVTQPSNMKNTKRQNRNKSGFPGVCFEKRRQKWHARIQSKEGKSIHLGYFDSLRRAAKVRKRAEIEFGYHPNHGRVAALS